MQFKYTPQEVDMNNNPIDTTPKKPHINVVFCIPGREFTMNFLQSWTRLVLEMNARGITFLLSNTYSPVVYYARTSCLRGHVLKGKKQLPFQGEITYDYLFWIDSDIVFNPEHCLKMLETMQNNRSIDVLSGLYPMADGVHSTCVEHWDEEFFKKNGTFQFLTMEDCQSRQGLFPSFYIGFGWLCVRQGVQEKFEYPFFKPIFHELDGGIYDFSSEDASWFFELYHTHKIKLWVDPTIRVGHEKMVVL